MSNVDPIALTGLRADLPIAAMAAFGCLRTLERDSGWHDTRLSWNASGGSFYPLLWPSRPREHGEDDLIRVLIEDVRTVARRTELNWSDQIKNVTQEDYRKAASQALDQATASDRDAADWFTAFGSELVLNEGKLESTPFDMSVARQKFLADARKLAESLGATDKHGAAIREAYREALFGPWKYRDDQHSLGWDPSTLKMGAFTHKAPTGLPNAGVRAAVWLAFESLPLFPCFYGRGLETRAFRKQKRELLLYWPVWNRPISLPVLKTLLGWSVITADPPHADELRARGVTAVYRSRKYKPNKYLASFRVPELVFQAAPIR